MSKWTTNFELQFKDTSTVRTLTKEINDALDKNKSQKKIDQIISEVIKGKHVRKGY